MCKSTRQSIAGYVLIEALVAFLVVALGVLALSKQTAVISSGGESRSRSEAMAISQAKMDVLRNSIMYSQFTGNTSGSENKSGVNANYNLTWTLGNIADGKRQINITTTWTDQKGNTQRVDLNSFVSWIESIGQGALSKDTSGNLISPTGSAKREEGAYTGQGVTITTDTATNVTKLIDTGTGEAILSLPPDSNGQSQNFTTINGKVYFDRTVNTNQLPSSGGVRVRLSSEGECIYDNSTLIKVPTGAVGSNLKYEYFSYTCYVGPGWYGNVAVMIDPDENANPTVCLGDPTFNSGTSNSTLISAHSIESASRSYRGFKLSGSIYLSTGVAGGRAYNPDGYPLPSNYPSYYPGIQTADNYFKHDFLLTRTSGSSCRQKQLLVSGEFTRNAGKYYCITPDNDSSNTDACPSIWPGFESEVGNGGSINYTLSVANSNVSRGTVTSLPSGINCGSNCLFSYASGTSVSLTATPVSGSVFDRWEGACSGNGACSVNMSLDYSVTAIFVAGATSYALSVNTNCTGSACGGTVTAPPGTGAGIDCGTNCSENYIPDSSVTLTAQPASGSAFTGWSGGGCSGNIPICTVYMDSAKSVTANFQSPPPSTFTLSVTKSGNGSGTVSSAPSGINCGSACSYSFMSGTTITLSAAATSGSFTGWSGSGCSGIAPCILTMSGDQSVTATFLTACNTPISGTAHDKQGEVSVTPSTAGTCSMNGGNSSGYSCTLTTIPGTSITLTNSRITGNTTQYSYELGITANCVAQTNVNFP